MLSEIADALVYAGLVPSADTVEDANFTWSHNISLLIDIRGGRSIFSKIGGVHDQRLAEEYAALKLAYGCLPNNVPEPLGLIDHGGLRYLFTAATKGKPLCGIADILKHKQNWVTCFATMRAEFGPAATDATRKEQIQWLTSTSPLFSSYCEQEAVRTLIEDLPSVRQHGDFYKSNILTSGGVPIFLDWEDFGAVDLPGFDIAMLLGSVFSGDPEQVFSLLTGNEASVWREVIQASEIDVEHFIKLLPVYYGLFYLLKTSGGYGQSTQLRAKINIELFCVAVRWFDGQRTVRS